MIWVTRAGLVRAADGSANRSNDQSESAERVWTKLAASIPFNGTPGTANSVATTNAARSSSTLHTLPSFRSRRTVSPSRAHHRRDDECNGAPLLAREQWRAPAFTSAAMFDDGAHGDGVAAMGFTERSFLRRRTQPS